MKCPKCHADNPDTKLFCADCGTKLSTVKDIRPEVTETLQAPVRDLTTGSTFAGRYQVIEELGKGGMGRVYKVFDMRVKEKVALKLIKPEIASAGDTIERFARELRLARRISHRNVCKMFDIGEVEGTHFITMEYVHGEDLKSMIRMAAGLSIGAVLSIGKQVCDGLAEAHGLGIVHRDLKPQNIMIDKGGNVKIMDFGIARSVREKGITGPSLLIGTPEYMSPEQAEAKEVDQRSDIYSLGIILYEMATGRVPFEGETALSIAMKHKGEAAKDPRQLNPQIPEDLSEVILKCLEKDPEKRCQDSCDVRCDLETIEKGLPRRTALSSEFGKPSKSVAVLPFKDLSIGQGQDVLADGIPEALISALSCIEGLRVSASTSSFFFKGKQVGIHEIGQKLGVENLLEGSVQVAGEKLRIMVRLVNIVRDSSIWSQDYGKTVDDVFAIQDDIARSVVRALKIKLLGEKEVIAIRTYKADREAYVFYLQGRRLWETRNREDVRKAVGFYEQAIAKDPGFALAYSAMADAHIILGDNAMIDTSDAYEKAKVAALKALELDDSLGEAQISLAAVLEAHEHRFAEAEKAYRRGIELKPAYAVGHFWYGLFLLLRRRQEEAIREIMLARELDPIAPHISASVGFALIHARQYDRAIEELAKSIELFPDHASNYLYLGWLYVLMGSYDKALDAFDLCLQLKGDEMLVTHWVAYCQARSGNKAEAEKALKKIIEYSKKNFFSATLIAQVYVGLEEKEQAFAWLDRALATNDGQLFYLNTDPSFDPLRSDPRFTELLRKIGY